MKPLLLAALLVTLLPVPPAAAVPSAGSLSLAAAAATGTTRKKPVRKRKAKPMTRRERIEQARKLCLARSTPDKPCAVLGQSQTGVSCVCE